MEHAIGRRSFLKLVGTATAFHRMRVAYAGDVGKSASAPPWRMHLSTSSIHFSELPIEQACERIAGLGFEAIDIWSAHEGCPHLDDVASRLGPDGLRTLLKKRKLKLFAFSVYQGGYARYAELLGQAGGGVAIQGSAAPCKPQELSARMRRFVDDLKPLIELAEKNNSCLAIENHGSARPNRAATGTVWSIRPRSGGWRAAGGNRQEVFRQRYRRRSGLESTNSGLKRRTGAGPPAARGRPRVFHAIYLKITGWNILRASVCATMRQLVQTKAQAAVVQVSTRVWTASHADRDAVQGLNSAIPAIHHPFPYDRGLAHAA